MCRNGERTSSASAGAYFAASRASAADTEALEVLLVKPLLRRFQSLGRGHRGFGYFRTEEKTFHSTRDRPRRCGADEQRYNSKNMKDLRGERL